MSAWGGLTTCFAFVVVGCASSGHVPYSERSASLVMQDTSSGAKGGGIIMVDHHRVRSSPGSVLRVPIGSHSISYMCPGFIYLHWTPTLAAHFKQGTAYRLVCDANGTATLVTE
jgi:hypothetical protein